MNGEMLPQKKGTLEERFDSPQSKRGLLSEEERRSHLATKGREVHTAKRKAT